VLSRTRLQRRSLPLLQTVNKGAAMADSYPWGVLLWPHRVPPGGGPHLPPNDRLLWLLLPLQGWPTYSD